MPSKSKSAKAAATSTQANGPSVAFTAPSIAPTPGAPPTAASGPSSDPAQHLLVDDAVSDSLPNGTSTPPIASKGTGTGITTSTGADSNAHLAYPLPRGISAETINNTESLLRFVILALISGAAIASRLFAVIRFESVIHEL